MIWRTTQILVCTCALGATARAAVNEPNPTAGDPPAPVVRDLVRGFCRDCHGPRDPRAGFDLLSIANAPLAQHSDVWEKVARKLRARHMPPDPAPRPDEATYRAALQALEQPLDQLAAQRTRPGRTGTFRRLTRTEYQHAIRDLLAIEFDAATLLPPDESSRGFDNITVGELPPTLVHRYLLAAQKISRLAVGRSEKTPGGDTFRIRPDVTQEQHVETLPIGTRGGALIPYYFPQYGNYEIQIRLARDRNEHVEGLKEPHELEILLDRERVALFTVRPPQGAADPSDEYSKASHDHVDRHLKARIPVPAGPHEIAVTFPKRPSSLLETARQPLNVHFNMYRHPRITPALFQVSITGPFDAAGSGDTPSRRRLFTCRPAAPDDEAECAKKILATMLRRACRQPVSNSDLVRPMALFHEARAHGSFEDGIELALSSILVHPKFLFRIERDPDGLVPGTAYQISDLELASRLSFFLWSSIPDDELLDLAEQGQLRQPGVLEQQTRRMLRDDRARALVENFAGQWLHLRNLDAITPDARLYPDFDDNLRQAFRRETELVFESILRENRSVLDLLRSDHTYLNERLAKHYGIPHVYGSRFRRVELDADSRRGGVLRHGSILTVTSYATRTSPVLRGKWVLENLLGTPPPPPPENVPALEDNTVASSLPVRDRLARHRTQPACASCHDLIDPVGFALENYDAVGRWRDTELGQPVDATGGLPDSSEFSGVAGLEQALLDRPDVFVGTMAEKLMTYAIGRGVEPFDAPAIRRIVRDAKADEYRFESLILGIVQSVPFQMRESQ